MSDEKTKTRSRVSFFNLAFSRAILYRFSLGVYFSHEGVGQ